MNSAADIGFLCLFLCAILCGYSVVASLLAARTQQARYWHSARAATTVMCSLAVMAAVILWGLFFYRDYSVAYIFKNSSNDLPSAYTVSAFWSSLEGSHTLWTLFLALFTASALWTGSKDNEHYMPYVSASLNAVLAWMFYLAISYSDPFVRMFPSHANGQGMNALLQNPYMAIHPPMLFLGYTALGVPFAYAMAALAYGDITEGWLRTVRRWSLFAWVVLSVGITLGGRWAYVELGWAGYWAWDPVENSSFMPWLMVTAMLHSLQVQEKLGQLKRLSIILAFLGFFFSFFGTFITRSGVISSVHSFAESPIGPNYLVFLGGMLFIVAALYAWRAQLILPPEQGKAWGISKESALVVTQFLILTFGTIIFIGTVYPIVAEALTGDRPSVQAPYFNAFAPWVGLGLVIAIALGNIMRYQSSTITYGKALLGGSAVAALPIAGWFIWQGDVMATAKPFALGAQLVGIFLCTWSALVLLGDFYLRLRLLRFKWELMWNRNRAYVGGLIAHLGLLFCIVGFLGNYRSVQTKATLQTGESASLYGYSFTFDGMKMANEHNATLYKAPLRVSRDGHFIGTIFPAKSQYPTKPELLNEVGLLGGFWHDIYAVVADFDRRTGASVTLEIHINPTVRVVWWAVGIMALGGLIALSDRMRGRSLIVGSTLADGAKVGAKLAMVLVAGWLLVLNQSAMAQGIPPPNDNPAAVDKPVPTELDDNSPVFRDVAGELRCPTCTGLSVLDSDAAFSVQIKSLVKEQLAQGKSKSDIVTFFTDRYGPWILRAPPTHGVHLSVWLVPVLIMLLGPLLLWLLVWRNRRAVQGQDAVVDRVTIIKQLEADLGFSIADADGAKGSQT